MSKIALLALVALLAGCGEDTRITTRDVAHATELCASRGGLSSLEADHRYQGTWVMPTCMDSTSMKRFFPERLE